MFWNSVTAKYMSLQKITEVRGLPYTSNEQLIKYNHWPSPNYMEEQHTTEH